VTGEHLGVDADAQLGRRADLRRRAGCAGRVVLVRAGGAEDTEARRRRGLH
jgi:hypothetical protein